MKYFNKILFTISIAMLFASSSLLAKPVANSAKPEVKEAKIKTLNIKSMTMRQFARLLSQGTNNKIIVSEGAGKKVVNIFLEDVTSEVALKAVCKSHNLWYKKDSKTDIISIITIDEFQKGMGVYSSESIKVITIKYPDARDVGEALGRLFTDRVVWQPPRENNDRAIEDIENALDRMDTLADRTPYANSSSGSGGANSSSSSSRNSSSRNSSSSRSRDSNRSNSNSRSTSSYSNNNSKKDHKVIDDIKRKATAESLIERLGRNQSLKGRIDKPGVVYVSVFKGTNDLLLRSSDPQTLEDIIKVINKLDKPKPQVLLEVKVLDITLDNNDSRGIDWLFKAGDFSGGRSIGSNPNATNYGEILPPNNRLIPQGTGLDPRATVLQLVTDNVLARIQFLEQRNRITRLATPTLCVADAEASRIFVGNETTILTSVTDRTTVTGGGVQPVVERSVNPETDRRNIGTTLIITPRIHADRTATIRIVQEDSRLGSLRTINFGQSSNGNSLSFQSQDVETRSVVTTVLSADGKVSAIGGLIREEISQQDSGVPGLMDMPWVGGFFKTTKKARERHELLVLIRPFILLAPGDAEPVTKSLLRRLSEHPSARDDIPALRIGEGDFLLVNEHLYNVPKQAIKAISKRANVWTTE